METNAGQKASSVRVCVSQWAQNVSSVLVVMLSLVTAVQATEQAHLPDTEKTSTRHLQVEKSTLEMPRVTSAPVIDGEINAEEWQQATQVELKYNIVPGDSTPAPVKTIAYIMEDGENLYVAFDARDPDPSLIRAFLRDRDKIFQDDFVGIVLDTFNDERRAFEFLVNPLGVQGDLTLDDNVGDEDSSWNTVWDSAGQVTAKGYQVELAIPFRNLRFTPDLPQQIWGIRFVRLYPRDSRMVIADTKNVRELDCSLCQINKVKGMPNLEANGANLDLTPTLTYLNSESRPVNPQGPWQTENNEIEAGLNMRWAMTEDWILNATINPDFSQVEADAGQLDINTTFSLFFPESRPFFLDGADYFKAPNRVVYTRNIADPQYGAKVTGKSRGLTLGVITAADDSTSVLLPSSQRSQVVDLGDSSDVLVVRGQFDQGEKNNIGAILTHRAASGYSNQVASLDGKYYITDKDVLRYQWMYSDTENSPVLQFDQGCLAGQNPTGANPEDCRRLAPEQSDDALTLSYQHNEENYSLGASYSDFGDDFRADMGFIGRVNYREFELEAEYIWYGAEGSKWTEWGISGDWEKSEEQNGRDLEEETEIGFYVNGPMQFNGEAELGTRDRFFNGVYFDEDYYSLFFKIKPHATLTYGLNTRFGDQVDFANTQLGEIELYEPFVEWEVNKHLNIDVEYVSQKLDVPGGNLFKAKLTDLRFAYQFNIRNRLSLTLQYTDIDRNLALYQANQDSDPDNDLFASNKDFGTQLIYSYKINPQSLFYLGYSDNSLENDSIDDLTRSDRTVFAKFSYLWQN